MRILTGLLSLGFGLMFLACLPLCYIVPRWKATAAEYGTPLSGIEMLLIHISDLVVQYWYMIAPVLLLMSVAAGMVALTEHSDTPLNES